MIERLTPLPISKAARNERRKAFATTLNAVAVSIFVYAILQPVMSGRIDLSSLVSALTAFVVLQGVLHYILKQVED